MAIGTWFSHSRTWTISRLFFVVAPLLVLSGCVLRSVEPLYEDGLFAARDKDLVMDQSVIGSWFHTDNECSWTLTVSTPEKEGFGYELTLTANPDCKSSDVDKRVAHYDGHVVKLDKKSFLDVSPRATEVCDQCLALHTFFLISEQEDQLVLTPIDGDWIKDAIGKGTVTLAHRNDGLTMTASSKDLKAFVRKYADDKAAFKPDPEFTFKKK